MNNPRHLFECQYPIPEGEIIYKKHPKLDCLVSNLGSADDKLPHYQFGRGKNLAQVVYETFIGHKPYGERIVHLNNNPYDCRPSNLALSKDVESEERNILKKQFNDSTVDEMIRRERKFSNIEEGIQHWESLNIKKSIIKMWIARSGLPLKQKED